MLSVPPHRAGAGYRSHRGRIATLFWPRPEGSIDDATDSRVLGNRLVTTDNWVTYTYHPVTLRHHKAELAEPPITG
jgi:hypothetical protein